MTYIRCCQHLLAEHAPETVKYRSTKVGRLTGRDFKEVATFILRLLFLTGIRVLIKIQRALTHREHWRK